MKITPQIVDNLPHYQLLYRTEASTANDNLPVYVPSSTKNRCLVFLARFRFICQPLPVTPARIQYRMARSPTFASNYISLKSQLENSAPQDMRDCVCFSRWIKVYSERPAYFGLIPEQGRSGIFSHFLVFLLSPKLFDRFLKEQKTLKVRPATSDCLHFG